MILQSIGLRDFRNLDPIKLDFHPRCNVFVGGNGQGKTSLLEAIYLLSRGQSFRTHIMAPLIRFERTSLMIQATTSEHASIHLEKTHKGITKVYINEKRCERMSALTQLLPCQLFHQDMFQIIDASSQIRRSLLDWGVFYAFPEYLQVWQAFKRALLQRNTVLKQKGSPESLQIWNQAFVPLSEKITDYRTRYLKQLNAVFQPFFHSIADIQCDILYFNGWDKYQKNLELAELLIQQEPLDRKLMYTHSGPHHADLLLLTPHGKGKIQWSRGQQKTILLMLKLAQAQLLERPCLYLLDDLSAELDQQHLNQIYQRLQKTEGQFFITALDDAAKNNPFFADSRWFYLNQGQIDKVIDL